MLSSREEASGAARLTGPEGLAFRAVGNTADGADSSSVKFERGFCDF